MASKDECNNDYPARSKKKRQEDMYNALLG
uniref:Uncharacterized protein n=1 Tax=Arundo donax TaxID=35708 RepID=A0A0A9ELC4_ARUDO